MGIEIEDILTIARKVNRMTEGQLRIRIKQLEQIRIMDFTQQVEFNYILMKIITPTE